MQELQALHAWRRLSTDANSSPSIQVFYLYCPYSTMGWFFFVAMVHLLYTASGQSQGINCPDEYLYTQQPPLEVVCNPYASGVLQLDCAIIGDDILDIRWFYSTLSSSDAVHLTNSTKYRLTPYTHDGTTGVLLKIMSLNEQDVGKYWCQGFIQNGVLTMSGAFMLFPENGYVDSPCQTTLRRSTSTCAEVIRVSEEVTTPAPTTFPPTTQPTLVTTLTPSSTPLLSTNKETSTSMAPTSATTDQTPPRDLVPPSEFTLYVVLGLVGFLGVICVLLGIVIVVLCRRRCQGREMNGSDSKEVKFDHLSNQSDFALLSLHKHPSSPVSPYQPESSQPTNGGTQRRDLSGDYAEIGPALIMNTDHLRHLHSSYSESGNNPPPLPQPNPGMVAFHSSVGMEVDPYSISGYENPYDLPELPPTDSRTGTNQPDTGTSQMQNYHVLERVLPLGVPRREVNSELFSDTSSFSTPPDSPPHNYQTLQNTSSTAAHTLTSSPSLPQEQVQEVRISPQGYEFPQEHRLSRLETIPEHPYHVLDKDESTTSMPIAADSIPVQADNSPDTTDDREYDRLVSPPHLYHILEHSPSLNKPRIHQFHFSDYNHLEKAAPAGREPVSSPAQAPSPTTSPVLPMLTDSFSSESSLSESEVFDDPQYLLSPESKRRSPSDEQSSKEDGAQAYTHNLPKLLTTQDTVDLTKYLGDYERDPVYMQRLKSISPKLYQLSRGHDLTGSQDDSGFCSINSNSHQTELKRQSSLPDIFHVYQPLQAKTMDPRLPYEKVKKCSSQSSEPNT